MKTFADYLKETGEYGVVQSIETPLFYVSGLPSVRPQEVVITENGSRGIVQVLLPDLVEVLMLEARNLTHQEKVARVSEPVSIEVSEQMLGRVVDPLGNPLDGLGSNTSKKVQLAIDVKAPGILQRSRVVESLETGVIIVDMMVQVGKGQKELVAGDQKTGKTVFLLQTMTRQAQLGIVCIYVCIGKKKSDLKHVQSELNKSGALKNTVIVAATASDPVSFVYIAPFAGFTIAEFFRDRGQNVCIILDDMTTHAKYYREIALVAKKTPGRGSYPGDVFHHQARLLERTGNIKLKNGKTASITAFPVAETQEGDLTGYIQTNLMAMTDGHLFFDVEEFKRGRRPAISHNLSVTRVGNQTQSVVEKDLRRMITFRLNNYYRFRETSSFGVEIPVQYSTEINFGLKIEALLDQTSHQIIPKPLQHLLLGLLFANFWNEKELNQLLSDKQKIIDAYFSGKLKNLVLEITKANNFEYLATLLSKNVSFLNNITGGSLQQKTTA
ncbi:MAG: ATP synthase subunit alpha [Candidatus Curtissbacteria bacterium GW2011_GWA1_41_11]|uniref:ATP synthase subunit alpha n=1 Tax=Candidatus Curtissbacteria bacterium GW2011_GWA1_41_11 TaxID=1618409 RepID=A0A0G0UB50_9BACT|nr:MAG: ATP synthase subunit alpha [Candidatus Curtissbacteria bacterium GW2011_GWA1_41_11]